MEANSRAPQAREAPATTKVPLDRIAPLLSCAVGKWLRAHGKTVRPKLTEEQKANLKMCFKMMDADGSGAIDAKELDAAFKLLGLAVTRREVEQMLAEVDRDGSGEVEYAEFVEIMTLQLTRLAEQKEAAQERRTAAAAAAGPGGGGSGAAASDAAIAAALPFDVVATAYRRKKLMGALEEDDKDFILSVAAAEEAEKRREEAEAAAAAARRSRRGSAVPSAASSRRPSAAPQPPGAEGSAAREQAPPLGSHASFLESLSAEERHIIGEVGRKQQQQQPRRGWGEPGGGQHQGAPAQGPAADAHLAALQAAGRAAPLPGAGAAPPRSASLPRMASAAATRAESFKVSYRLCKSAAADRRAAPAAGAEAQASQGLRLLAPQFSSQLPGGPSS